MFPVDAKQVGPIGVYAKVEQEQETASLVDFKVKVEDVEGPEIEVLNDWSVQSMQLKQQGCDDLEKTGVYRCEFCPTMLPNRHKLAQHQLQHLEVSLSAPQIYQCAHCLVVFTKKNSLIRHITVKHCRIYNRNITKRKHECKICKKTYKYKVWHEHMRTVHSNVLWQCEVCAKNFKTKHIMLDHIRHVHESQPRYPRVDGVKIECQKCNKVFKGNDGLYQHVKNVHSSNGKKFICVLCGSALKSAPYLRQHVRRVHYSDGKQHECGICNKKFRSSRYLNVHKKNTHWKTKNKITFESPVKEYRKRFVVKVAFDGADVVDNEINVDVDFS